MSNYGEDRRAVDFGYSHTFAGRRKRQIGKEVRPYDWKADTKADVYSGMHSSGTDPAVSFPRLLYVPEDQGRFSDPSCIYCRTSDPYLFGDL